jgi:hypothetical protein
MTTVREFLVDNEADKEEDIGANEMSTEERAKERRDREDGSPGLRQKEVPTASQAGIDVVAKCKV